MSSGLLGRSYYVTGKFTVSNLCVILTPKNHELYPINLQFYQLDFDFIQKKLVRNLGRGSSKVIIREKDFSDYYIKYVPLSQQNDISRDYIAQKEKEAEYLKLV
eukprot:SAG22_NODE_2_length_61565_cov_858.782010_57_plen_104_part_00